MKKYSEIELGPPCIWNRLFVTGLSKLDNEGPHKSEDTANNFEFMYS
jgi:hypothetical protein